MLPTLVARPGALLVGSLSEDWCAPGNGICKQRFAFSVNEFHLEKVENAFLIFSIPFLTRFSCPTGDKKGRKQAHHRVACAEIILKISSPSKMEPTMLLHRFLIFHVLLTDAGRSLGSTIFLEVKFYRGSNKFTELENFLTP